MPNDRFQDYGPNVVDMAQRRLGDEKPPGPPLQPPGGGDGGGMTEARVAVLETHVTHIKDDVGDMKQTLKDLQKDTTALRIESATLTEGVKHLPSKGFVVTATLIALAFFAAVVLFQGNLQRAFNIVPNTPNPAAFVAPLPK
jgi:hypothetical protein